MTTLTLAEAQTRLPDVVHRLRPGEEVLVTEGGQVVARIVGEGKPAWRRPGPGLCNGMLTVVSEDDEHLKDFEE